MKPSNSAWFWLLALLLLPGCATRPDTLPVSCLRVSSSLPWGALSGLSADPQRPGILYSVHDRNLHEPAIYVLTDQARIVRRLNIQAPPAHLPYDFEGIAKRAAGGFWLASEGKGRRGIPNRLVRVDDLGRVVQTVPLPAVMQRQATQAGFEGIATQGRGRDERVIVAVQRPWPDDPPGMVKIAEYRPTENRWRLYHYPLDLKKGVGISALSPYGNGFAALERDNRSLRKSRLKRIYTFELDENSTLITKHLHTDLQRHINTWSCSNRGKLEGMAFDRWGHLYLVDDDDGAANAKLLRFSFSNASSTAVRHTGE